MPALIVLGVDGSERSLSALRWAADRGRERGWPVRIVHVLDDAVRRTHLSPEVVADAAKRIVDDARAVVAGRMNGIAIETLVASGPPPDVLLRSAQDSQLLVLGRRGSGAFGTLLLGSTAFAVASRTPIPLVVVPETVSADSEGPVVVGVDGSPRCLDALEFGFDFADRAGSPLHVVHVWDLPQLYGWDDDPGRHSRLSRLENDARLTISETLAGWREKYPDVAVLERPLRGHPVAALAASTHDARLLVVGGLGHGEPAGISLGSVARGVLQYAHGPVAVVPDRQWVSARMSDR